MRDIYTHGIITSDFVLVAGDLVSNIRIDEVVRVHKERRKTNKDAIMTMVVKESGAHHRTWCVSSTGLAFSLTFVGVQIKGQLLRQSAGPENVRVLALRARHWLSAQEVRQHPTRDPR